MKIAVAKETSNGEKRVALIPESVKKLKAKGFTVLVERGAGDGSFITDAQYTEAGAELCSATDLASADAVCFWRGRIKFRGASAGAPFDSLFAAWNCRSRFVEAFAPHGAILGRVS